jgi:hypothetical protein
MGRPEAYLGRRSGVFAAGMASALETHRATSSSPPSLAPGDHIRVFRGYFWHHGLYVGKQAVIHIASEDDAGKQSARVRCATLLDFAQGGEVVKVNYGQRLSAEESIARAEASLGRSGYHLGRNNCEHFVTWCVTGHHSSAQIENVSSGAAFVGGATVAPRAGVGLVTAAGDAPALSGPNLMSGLKAVGAGSVVAGVGVLATAGAAVGAGSMCVSFRDRQSLPADERAARSAGRVGGVGGGALGVVGVLYSVGALGASGYSAAGLSSGLAALGAPLGGGMVAGVTVAVAAPAILAALLAIALYYLSRWRRARPNVRPALGERV